MSGLILLTGATGYVGGRRLTILERTGRGARCLTRLPEALRGRIIRNTEFVAAAAIKADSEPDPGESRRLSEPIWQTERSPGART